MHTNCASSEEVRLICESSTETSQRSLTLLRAIDMTIDSLVWLESQAKTTVHFTGKAIASIKVCSRTNKIDPTEVVSSSIITAEESSVSLYNLLLSKKNFAIAAQELDGDDKESVVEAYAHAIAAVADLHNSLVDLRWAIGEHDADLDKPSGKLLSTSKEIAEYLDAL